MMIKYLMMTIEYCVVYLEHIGHVVRMWFLDTEVHSLYPGSSMLFP